MPGWRRIASKVPEPLGFGLHSPMFSFCTNSAGGVCTRTPSAIAPAAACRCGGKGGRIRPCNDKAFPAM